MLKKILFGVAIVSVPALGLAEEPCKYAEEFAGTVMEGRQYGYPLSRILDQDLPDLGRAIVLDAYDSPRYSSQEMKEQAISEFQNQVYMACIER